MPKFTADTDMQTHSLGGNFQFSSTKMEKLGATEYSLATIAIDVTGSTRPFASELKEALKTSVQALKKSPRASNLLVRVTLFSTNQPNQPNGGITELHGFKPLSDIDVDAYPDFSPDGATNLFDAAWEAVEATAKYGQELKDNDFLSNAILFLITDGGDNVSSMTPSMIKQQVDNIRTKEILESIQVILIGINDAGCKAYLDRFERDADLDGYKSIAEATPQNLGKLAKFVSNSVSSTSQSLGSGGPSQSIAATI